MTQDTTTAQAPVVSPTKEQVSAMVKSGTSSLTADRASQAKVQVFSFIDKDKPAATLGWKELGFSVVAKGGRKQILKEVSGDLRPGELTCILGPSGCGKTSMLNILAGRVRQGGRSKADIAGEIRVNGKVIQPSKYQQIFGYVMQDDALLGTMTPREVLKFAAKLRLHGHTSDSASGLIDDLLRSMGLTKCADTVVGNELIKGISGGERKRTAVGAELITNPQITFLDEPTSGLDTGAAYDVVTVLKQLSQMSRSVMCTIHQPSSEILHLFDQAIFLVEGQVAYMGSPHDIRAHFSKIDLICPDDYNPADFVLFCIQTHDDERIRKVVLGWTEKGSKRAPVQDSADVALPTIPQRKGFCTELAALALREVKNTLRDKATLGARFGSTIFLTLIYGLVFFQIGNEDMEKGVLVTRDGYDGQSHAGALTMVGVSGMFGAAQPLLLTFASERPVFIREHSSNMYGPIPYFISKTAVELPLVGLQTLLMWVIAYFLMGMNGNFIVHFFGTCLISLASASTALLAASSVSDAKQAMEVAPGLFVPQILFAGFFIKMESIPVFARWLQYICSLKWGMNILLWNEFFEDDPSLLEVNDIDADQMWLYVLVLLAITFVFRTIAAVVLSRKAKAFYN
mmetsp:Transcript_121378/g.348777  ORF Transcript_121378/g.348777 Transcript_121378/m.348777 type:complete len:628 (+) Transcript_121378:79-1962(+)